MQNKLLLVYPVETIDFDEAYDLVGITGFPSQIGRTREIALTINSRSMLLRNNPDIANIKYLE